MTIYRVTMNDGVTFHMDANEDDMPARVALTHKFPIPDNMWADSPLSWKGSGETMERLATKLAGWLELDNYDVAEIVELAPEVMPPRRYTHAVHPETARGQYIHNRETPRYAHDADTRHSMHGQMAGGAMFETKEAATERAASGFSNLRSRITRMTALEKREKAQEEIKNIENCLGRLKIILEYI